MLSSFHNYEATFTKTAIKSNSLHVDIPNSLHLEIPRCLEIPLRHFFETWLAKSISRESANKDCNSSESENQCDVIVTWHGDREKIMSNVIVKFQSMCDPCVIMYLQ